MCKIEGAFPEIYQPIADDLQLISKTLRDASFSSDLVLLIAGTSMGQKDFVKEAVRCEGEVILHGVAIKPGRPVLLGVVNEKPVLGLPGFPVACMLNFELFGIPVIRGYLSIPPKRLTKIKATFARSVPSSSSAEEFLRVRVAKVGQRFIATPLQRGSGIFSSLVKADGIVRIPYLSEGISVGQEHEVLLLRDLEEITNTIVVIGSCDHTIDLLANMLHKKFPFLYLSSANVGSMGGLMALKRREAHVAGCHLLDEKTGEYNIPFIKNMLEDLKVCVVNLVHRIQGFIVAPGNPKGIKDLKDLSRSDVRFINRQRGSGTRLLLDYHLKKYKIPPESINGYTQEEFTHISVASKVSKGIADVGLGILAAARALKLDFIPLTEERFDLVIPQSYLDSNPIKCLLQIIRSFPFKNKVEDLGGYNTKDTGKVLYSS
jgi:putative molybdopterin biosynthesis protein